MKFKDRLIQFMQGRYGADQFSRFLSWASIILLAISLIISSAWSSIAGNILWWIALAMLILCYVRMFSKNYSKRYQENQKYLKIKNSIVGRFSKTFGHLKQLKTHRFYSCPKCSQKVRIPRGKGKIRITCPKCRETFVRKS